MSKLVTFILVIVIMIGLVFVLPDYVPYLRFIVVTFMVLLSINLIMSDK